MGIKLMFRTGLIAAMLMPVFALAQTKQPQLSGVWEMDTAKSHVVDGRTITMTVEQTPDRLTVTEAVKTATATINGNFIP